VRDRALLIEGPPGSGKSSLALSLIDRGAVLVGDDSVLLEVRGNRLVASSHRQTRGLIEVRNVGLLAFPVCDEAPVALVLQLDDTAPRFIESAATCEIEGIPLPVVRLFPDSQVLSIRAELALARHGLPIVPREDRQG